MVDGETPTVDFDEIMGRVRAEVQRRRGLISEPPGADVLGLDLSPSDLEQVNSRLHAAEQVADIGARLPPMHRQHGLKRRLAALVAKAFLRLGELVNRDQRLVNRSLIY